MLPVMEHAGLTRLEFDDPAAGLMAYSVGGKITAEQAQEVFDAIQAAADAGRKLRLYYELHGFPTAEPSVFVEKLKHMGAIWRAVERMAIVGDQRWLGVYTKLMDPVTKPDLRHFGVEEREAARAWLAE